MNLSTHIDTQNSAGPRRTGRNERAIALVITLLMLSVITFLAVAFLAMTDRDKGAVNATLDIDTARSMSEAALARAQAQIIAQMMTNNDVLSYDYTASHNFINPGGFDPAVGAYNPVNVNYDINISGKPYSAQKNPLAWAENIANLFWDPRPPVFVMTNGNQLQPSNDFRFWVDINRNGSFETNGPVQDILPNGTANGTVMDLVNGEPEWIGVLKYPETNHSPINPFIGRYAFMVLPIGKTLDLNYIHNYSKAAGSINLNSPNAPDNYIRDEGIGPWELNLAALFSDINTNIYPTSGPFSYNYTLIGIPPTSPNTGNCFADAAQFIRFRYAGNANLNYPQDLPIGLGITTPGQLNEVINNIDEYANSPSLNPVADYTTSPSLLTSLPWPGSYNTNLFYDVQDLFDTTKTGPNFAPDWIVAMTNQDSYNRYTLQRLLACIGTSSTPEYGVYVYTNTPFTNCVIAVPTNVAPPSMLRTKVNINYNNTAQIQAGPYTPYGSYTPMPTGTNLVLWTNNALGFFTNAADLLLRSQVFIYTNYITNVATYPPNAYVPSNYVMATFGITNIPVYIATNPGITYNEQVHRMLQMAANIYAAAYPVYSSAGVPQPPIFRPQFMVTQSVGGTVSNVSIYITNFVQVTNNGLAQMTQILNPVAGQISSFKDLTNTSILPNDNIWGIPWIIGAVTNIPQFDQYSYQYRVLYQRALQFVRYPTAASGLWNSNSPPQYTNQFYEMSISNICGMDAWNPYSNTFTGSTANGWTVIASNFITVTITNDNFYVTNINIATAITNIGTLWPGIGQQGQFQTFLTNIIVSLPFSYFSEFALHGNFYTLPMITLPVTPTNNLQSFLAGDTTQTIYPTHLWTVSVTNHVLYALFDGNPTTGNANLLDFVNLGPFGSSFPVTQYLTNLSNGDPFTFAPTNGAGQPGTSSSSWWWIPPATTAGTTNLPLGVLNQINNSITGSNLQFYLSLIGSSGDYSAKVGTFGIPTAMVGPQYNTVGPYANYATSNGLSVCDPLVHYTLGDLTWPGSPQGQGTPVNVWSGGDVYLNPPWITGIGSETARYQAGIAMSSSLTANMIFADPGMTSANNWQFPTNLFPGIGWLGRVHRGTPWQTIFLKSDDTNSPSISYTNWYTNWVNSPFTYPTNDWSLVDLFTAVPNDNAACGLLSVNQTNSAAWAAVFAGVIALNSPTTGAQILPSIDPTLGFGNNVYSLMDYTNGNVVGINQARMNTGYNTNGLFHKIGDILQASSLTTQSTFVTNVMASGGTLTDEMVERIPQQTLSLLKLGMPQFVIYSWGQALKPANQSLYSAPGAPATIENICTNYEITGEFLTRTVCHIVNAPPGQTVVAPRIVIDSYNIEPGN